MSALGDWRVCSYNGLRNHIRSSFLRSCLDRAFAAWEGRYVLRSLDVYSGMASVYALACASGCRDWVSIAEELLDHVEDC